MTTIKDIAKDVGVSVATVSRALNDSGYVSAEVKEKVARAAEKLDYVPNEVARSLHSSQSRVIGVLVPDISNPYFPRVIRGIEDEANKNNYRVLLGNTDHNVEKERKYLEIFHQNNCAGIISATWTIDEHHKKIQVPVVMIDRVNEDYLSVEADNYTGGTIQAEHLVNRGAKHILVIAGPKRYSSFRNRTMGASKKLNDLKVKYEIIDSQSARQFIDKEDTQYFSMFDSVICPNDMFAYELLNFLNEYHFNIPENIKVIGFDDLEFSRWVSPSLTTIKQPGYEMGRRAFNLLMQQDRMNHTKHVLEVQLVQRKST